ncbi:MAG: hypothetical protein OWP43_08975 [Sphaerochaetaceae bacterium]|nr:hypothetical protein [Sphaerochaetaceae bacterium]
MKEREELIKSWFSLWVNKTDFDFNKIFDKDVIYIESWGAKYYSLDEVKNWFNTWIKTGEVINWNIKQFFHKDNQTIVEWFFECKMYENNEISCFDGMSLIKWSEEDKIYFLKEYKCEVETFDDK